MKKKTKCINSLSIGFVLIGLSLPLPAVANVMGSVGNMTVCSERFDSADLRMSSLIQAINGRFSGTNRAIIQFSIQHNGMQQCANIWYQVR